MELEIVTVGTELILGLTVDTNAAYVARALASVGARVVRKTSVPDESTRIRSAVGDALKRTGTVVVTGGLGPTKDDVTKHAVAKLFDVPVELDAAYLDQLKQRFADMGRGPLPRSNWTQAEVPRGATVLPNPRGTAPGLWFEGPLGVAVLLPGVPHEMRGMVDEEVIPRLAARAGAAGQAATGVVSLTLRTTGIAESALATELDGIEDELAAVTLAYLPTLEGVDLRLTAWDRPLSQARQLLGAAADRLRPRLGHHYYGDDGIDLAALVLDQLRRRSGTLAVAESCTGGLLSGRLTAVPGASDVFLGGVVCYSNESKVRDLEVSRDVIQQHGAVSEPVARALAVGAQRRFGSTASIAVTGIAGPAGGTQDKPVGTVWLAARLGEDERAVRRGFPGAREEIRERASQAALDLLRRLMSDSSEGRVEDGRG